VRYANALSQWLSYKPTDTAHNLVASWHVYDFNACNNVTCWDKTVAPVAQRVPIVTGEFGEKDQGVRFVTTLLTWLDRLPQGASYLAWTWDAWKSWDALIIDYNGTPNPANYGMTYYDYLTGGTIVGRQLQTCRLELCDALLIEQDSSPWSARPTGTSPAWSRWPGARASDRVPEERAARNAPRARRGAAECGQRVIFWAKNLSESLPVPRTVSGGPLRGCE